MRRNFQEFIFEARGIFNSAQIGKQLMYKDKLYDIVTIGPIDDWSVFSRGKKYFRSGKSDPKFYTKVENGKETIWLVGSSAVTSPGKFDGWGWPTASKTKTVKLKPQDFPGITDKWMKVKTFRNLLFKAIDKRADLTPPMRDYLKSLFDYYVSGKPVRNYESLQSNKNAVLRDYGEITGTIWYLAQHHSLGEGSVFLPHAGNYPLIDSILKIKGDEIKVSSKSGSGVSNTVKGADLLTIVNEMSPKARKTIFNKYKTEWQILKTLNDNNTVIGSIKAFQLIEPAFSQKHKKAIDQMLKTKVFRQYIGAPTSDDLIKGLLTMVPFNTKRSKGDINTKAGALSLMSKHIEKQSHTMRFRELADEILNGRVIYIYAKSIDTNGVIHYKASSADIPIKGAYLRYKGTITRAADKLGLQLKT